MSHTGQDNRMEARRADYYIQDGARNIQQIPSGVHSYVVFDVWLDNLSEPSLGAFQMDMGQAIATNRIWQTLAHIGQNVTLGKVGSEPGVREVEHSYQYEGDTPKLRVYMERLKRPDGYWVGCRFVVSIYDPEFRFGSGLMDLISQENPAAWKKKSTKLESGRAPAIMFGPREQYRFVKSEVEWARLLDAYQNKEELSKTGRLEKVKDANETLDKRNNPANPRRFFTWSRSLRTSEKHGVRDEQRLQASYWPGCTGMGPSARMNSKFNERVRFPFPEDVFQIDMRDFTPDFLSNVMLPGARDDDEDADLLGDGEDAMRQREERMQQAAPAGMRCMYDVGGIAGANSSSRNTMKPRQFADRLMNFSESVYGVRYEQTNDVETRLRAQDPLYEMSDVNEEERRRIEESYEHGSSGYRAQLRQFKTKAVTALSDYMFSTRPERSRPMRKIADWLRKTLRTRKNLCVEPQRPCGNLSTFGNAMMRKMLQLDDLCKLWTVHRQLLTLFYFSMDAYRHEHDLHNNVLMSGAGQTSKTYMLEDCLKKRLMIEGTIDLVNHLSANAYNTDQSHNDEVTAASEASLKDLAVDQYGKQTLADPQKKDRLTQMRTQSHRCVYDKDTGKTRWEISVCDCVGVDIMCTNEKTSTIPEALASRYYIMLCPTMERSDISSAEIRECASDTRHVDNEKLNEIATEWRMEQALIFLVEKMLRVGIIKIDVRTAEREVRIIAQEMQRVAGVKMCDRDRQRIVNLSRTLTIVRAIEILFRCEFSNQYAVSEFRLEQLLDIEPYLECTKEIVWFSMSLLQDMYLPINHLEMVKAAVRLLNRPPSHKDRPSTWTDYRRNNTTGREDDSTEDYRYFRFDFSVAEFAEHLSERMKDPRPSSNDIISMLESLRKLRISSRVRDNQTGSITYEDEESYDDEEEEEEEDAELQKQHRQWQQQQQQQQQQQKKGTMNYEQELLEETKAARSTSASVSISTSADATMALASGEIPAKKRKRSGDDPKAKRQKQRERVPKKERIPAVVVTHDPDSVNIAVDLFYEDMGDVVEECIKRTRDAHQRKMTAILGKIYSCPHPKQRFCEKENSWVTIGDAVEVITYPHLLCTMKVGPRADHTHMIRHYYAINKLRESAFYAPTKPETHFQRQSYSRVDHQIVDCDLEESYALEHLVNAGFDCTESTGQAELFGVPAVLESARDAVRQLGGAKIYPQPEWKNYPHDVAEYLRNKTKKMKRALHARLTGNTRGVDSANLCSTDARSFLTKANLVGGITSSFWKRLSTNKSRTSANVLKLFSPALRFRGLADTGNKDRPSVTSILGSASASTSTSTNTGTSTNTNTTTSGDWRTTALSSIPRTVVRPGSPKLPSCLEKRGNEYWITDVSLPESPTKDDAAAAAATSAAQKDFEAFHNAIFDKPSSTADKLSTQQRGNWRGNLGFVSDGDDDDEY